MHLGAPSTRKPSMHHPKANAILSQLPEEQYRFLHPHMKLVSLKKGEILLETGRPVEHYFFPVSCAVELVVDLEDGNAGSATVINMNGMYPLHLIGESLSHQRAAVCSTGLCYRIPAWVIHQQIRRDQSLLWLLLKEAVKIFQLVSIESVCLRHHTLGQVTAKLILLSLDNSATSVVAFTQQEMANSLGVRREGVTMTLQKFKTQKFITTHRGGLTVIDRTGLEGNACACYKTLSELRKMPASGKPMEWTTND